MFLSNLNFLHFIPDIINSLLILSCLLYFCAKYNIKKNSIIILSFLLFTPFLFYFLFPYDYFPDQSKYADIIYNTRNLSFFKFISFSYLNFTSFSYDKFINFLLDSRVEFSSFIYAFFPLPFVSTIISVGLINKGILYSVILYFYNKKKYFLINLLLFLPSMILFSSVALREVLVISVGIIFSYIFFEKKKYSISLLFFVVLLMIKPHFTILYLIVCISYYIFFIKLNLKLINQTSFNWLLLLVILLMTSSLFFQEILIKFRNGFFLEEFGYALIRRNETITLFTTLNSLIQFSLSPFLSKEFSFLMIVIFIENLFLLYVIIILLNKIYKENQCKAIFWTLALLFLFTIFGFVIFNAGTVWRYKLVIQIIIISSMYFSLNRKNRYINLI
jgi:hypothetical protein